jgi:hypothetical protein
MENEETFPLFSIIRFPFSVRKNYFCLTELAPEVFLLTFFGSPT